MSNYKPIKIKSIVYGLRKYIYALLPFIFISTYSIYNAYQAINYGAEHNYKNLSIQQIIDASNTIFWVGVIVSSTMVIIVAINDIFDLILRLLHKAPK